MIEGGWVGGGGVLCQFFLSVIVPGVLFPFFFSIIKTLVTYNVSHPYFTGVATAQLWQHLPNMNVILNIKQVIMQSLEYPLWRN